ncbi:MAG: AI-2E family transporter [Vicinamibacterales bacterium]
MDSTPPPSVDDVAVPAEPPSQRRVVLQVLLAIAVVGAGGWALHRLKGVVLLLILAMFFAYLIAPLVRLAERPYRVGGQNRHLPRPAAILLVYLLLTGVVGAGALILVPRVTEQIGEAITHAPAYTESFRVWQRGWSRYYDRLRIPPELRGGIDQSLSRAGETANEYARGAVVTVIGALAYVPWVVLIPVMAFLFLKDVSTFRRATLTGLPHRIRLPVHRLFEDLNDTLAAYMRAQLIACVLVGGACGIGFALLGVPYAALLGVVAGVLEFIPLVGPLLVAMVACTIAAFHGVSLALQTVAFLGVLRIVEDYMVYPRLIGRDIELHPLVVLVAVLAGLELGGVAGIFLSVPAVAVVTVVGRHWLRWAALESQA